MSVNDEQYRQMREYSRVDTTLPLSVQVVPPAERRSLQSRTSMECVMTDPPPLPVLRDDALSEALRTLNAKLDLIIGMLSMQRQGLCSLTHTRVNLSGGGMRLSGAEEFQPEDIVEVRLMLPPTSRDLFILYGQVVRCEMDADAQYKTCIEFIEIDEDIRDRITKYVFEKQREMLRRMRRQ